MKRHRDGEMVGEGGGSYPSRREISHLSLMNGTQAFPVFPTGAIPEKMGVHRVWLGCPVVHGCRRTIGSPCFYNFRPVRARPSTMCALRRTKGTRLNLGVGVGIGGGGEGLFRGSRRSRDFLRYFAIFSACLFVCLALLAHTLFLLNRAFASSSCLRGRRISGRRLTRRAARRCGRCAATW